MGSASIYRYVASRDELLGRLLVAVYDELGAFVEGREAQALHAWASQSRGRPRADAVLSRWRAICGAVRAVSYTHLDVYKRQLYHPVGTCRIGTDPATSVVDPHLQVHGIDGLRAVSYTHLDVYKRQG